MGRLYVDGRLASEQQVTQRPDNVAERLTEAYIGRSPFAADALMAEVFFDDFQIYDVALDEGQARELYARVKDRAGSGHECRARRTGTVYEEVQLFACHDGITQHDFRQSRRGMALVRRPRL